MTKKTILILILIALIGLFSPIVLVHADPQPYNALAQLPCPSGVSGCSGNNTSYPVTGDLSGYLNTAIAIFIGICAVLAVIMIIIGGLEYMTSELISNKEHGKERITNAIFGLLLALGAWTILNTINPNLLKTDLSNMPSTAPSATGN